MGLAIGMASCSSNPEVDHLDTKVDSLSYALGVDTSINLPKNFENVNGDAFLQGIKDSKEADLDENPEALKISLEVAPEYLRGYFSNKQAKRMQEQQARIAAQAEGVEYVAPENEEEPVGVFKSGQSKLGNSTDSLSYSVGMNLYASVQKMVPELEYDLFYQGYKQGPQEGERLMQAEQCGSFIQAYMNEKRMEDMKIQREEAIAKAEKEYADVKAAGLEFLAENAKREGVIVTDSGLQYEIIKEGNGVRPNGPAARVEVHYVGTTPEGEVFDSSRARGETSTFGLNQVVKGWTEGIQLMDEGAVYKFYIPQELAYGATPRPGSAIKPFMPLVFEVELFKAN